MKINVRSFSLSCGLFWGIGLFLITWWVILLEGASGTVTLIGRIYFGYNISPMGSIIGLVWAFVDGIIGGAVFAWLYNLLNEKFKSTQA